MSINKGIDIKLNVKAIFIDFTHDYAYEGNYADGRIVKTFGEIKQIYCPDGADNDPNNLNPQWLGGIASMMNEMGINVSANSSFTQMGGQLRPIKPIKPKTAFEQAQEKQANHEKLLKSMGFSTKESKGRIINGLYIDPNQKFESVDDRRMKIGYTEPRLAGYDWKHRKSDDAKINEQSIAERVQKEYEENPEYIIKKRNWTFNKIMSVVEEVTKEYMADPVIESNVNYHKTKEQEQ